ncbi:peptide ABC transporter substrate-binding protein [Longimycelium tulufanense]|uniref:Peptide ABC transporter substrate-binding protein n=1 Tax=Longimycelium tulufanense TaxID=907463 RepID=A0A8J3CBG3_9PSEU|nr:ABC transporter family substrate-binding protein [Longimycelium tulufanense]GGM43067.1 peptide ABC transporter substrate-binding protein [Longimycelium tulufanense]
MRRARFVSAVALLSGAALVLSACGGGGGTGGDSDVAAMAVAKGQHDGNYTAPEVSDAGAISVSTDKPFTAYNNQTTDANSSYNNFALVQVQIGAFTLNGNNKVLLNKDVMDSVEETSTDPQTVTYKIKKGVTWSDGEPWDCDDFYLTWLAQSGKAKKPDGGTAFLAAGTSGYDLIESVECPDPQTVVTKYSSPYPDWKGLFNNGSITPAHILEQQTGIADITQLKPDGDPAELARAGEFWNTGWRGFKKDVMPASGPYMITDWQQNVSVTLERNPKWAGAKAGPSRITLKAIPDSVAQAQALENNENQVMSAAQPDINAADRLRGLSAQGVTYGAAPGLAFEHLDLNFARPLLAQEAVRKAFFQCVNREEIANKLIGSVEPDIKPLNSLLFFPQDDGYQDVYSDKTKGGAEAAKKTLQEAGWQQGSDGVFVKDGQRLRLSISHTDIPRRKQTVELIQGQCKDAGIEVEDNTDANFLSGRVDKGDYDIALFAWSGGPFKADKKPIYISGGSQNWQKLSSPKADEALEKAVTQTSQEAAIPYYQEADKALAETYGSLPLFQMPSMWAFRDLDRVYFQSYYGTLWNANEWQKKTS